MYTVTIIVYTKQSILYTLPNGLQVMSLWCKDFLTGDDWVDGGLEGGDTTDGDSGGGGEGSSGVPYCFESNY